MIHGGMTKNQLGDMLHESGTANITFMMDINMGLKYKVTTTSEENLIGEATLSWSGMCETLQLTHEEHKVSWVKYGFTAAKLIMIVTE
jgi:hypothetical protein